MTPLPGDEHQAARGRSLAAGEARMVAVLLLVGFALSFATVKVYRAAGQEPRFYQENFGPAVMMACGYGFTAPPFESGPASLLSFLQRRQNEFHCADFGPNMATETVTWNGTWYYLYGTTALIWRVTGISWTALDGLAATFGGVVLAALYGLFRLVSTRRVAVVAALFVMLSPANLVQLPMLRDFSKAPFVLVSVLLLAWLVMRPLGRRATVALAAAFGGAVGLGYGFRSDLIVMAPFGVAVIAFLLPGSWRAHWRRNFSAAAVALAAFVVVGWPPLKGQETGGCQFHYSLLGLTAPLTREMGIQSPMYGFGDHFLDTFVDLKVGDYGNRVMGLEVPNLCAPDYDIASAQLFFRMARTFPSDLVVHAYGSVLTILRSGFTFPSFESLLGRVPWAFVVARPVDRVLNLAGMMGPVITAAAVALAWNVAPRLGIALAAFVLFLTGYPAIEFEMRHWFHLRFIPLWAALAVWESWANHRRLWQPAAVIKAVLAVAGMLLALAGSLGVLRMVQRGPVSELIESYLAAPTETMPTTPTGDSALAVAWQPIDYAPPPAHRSSDLLVVTVEPIGCGAAGPLDVRIRYDADLPSHDMSSTVTVVRGEPGQPPTQLFFPVFSQGHLDQTYLRFAAVEVPGRPTGCISRVARVSGRQASPLWVQVQVPPDWTERSYYQMLRTPRFLRAR